MTDIVERLRGLMDDYASLDALAVLHGAEDEIERLRAVIVRAKDALLDGQSTQWVHDVLVEAIAGSAR